MAKRRKDVNAADTKAKGRPRGTVSNNKIVPLKDTPKQIRARHPGRRRRRRRADTPAEIKPAKPTPTKKTAPPPKLAVPDDRAVFEQLLTQAGGAKRETIARLRVFLDRNPTTWQETGVLSAFTEETWLALIADADPVRADSIQRQLEELKGELMGPNLALLESRLVKEFSANWLGSQFMEMQAAGSPGGVPDQAPFRMRLLAIARKRCQIAYKMLRLLYKHQLRTLVALYAVGCLLDLETDEAPFVWPW